MNILGLNGALNFDGNQDKTWAHGSSATLVVDKELIGSCTEERFTRIKFDGNFPINSIQWLLKEKNLSRFDIDVVSYVLDVVTCKILSVENIKHFFGNQFPNAKIEIVDHHLAHTMGSVLTSNFDECNVLSLDGVGSALNLNYVNDIDPSRLTTIANWGFFGSYFKKNNCLVTHNSFYTLIEQGTSVGDFYGTLAENLLLYMGYKTSKSLREASSGKIMGLSAYGNPNNVKAPKVYEITEAFGFPYIKFKINYLTTGFKNSLFGSNYLPEDIAAWIQRETENMVIDFLQSVPKEAKKDTLCFTGGVALNILLNSKIISDGYYKDVHVMSAPGDDGLSLGAALHTAKKNQIEVILPENIGCLGLSYELNKTHKFIIKIKSISSKDFTFYELCDNLSIKYSELNYAELYDKISDELVENKVIGWFQGKSEYGPRALCNRSILANPMFNNKDLLNKKVKNREWWRPYAAVVLEEHFQDWFDIPKKNSHYMLFAGLVKPDKKSVIPSIVHTDGTCRIQTINKKLNDNGYALLQEFYKKTNVPILLNTSFNTIKGEPIVETPVDAINSFYNSSVDTLVINNTIFKKSTK